MLDPVYISSHLIFTIISSDIYHFYSHFKMTTLRLIGVKQVAKWRNRQNLSMAWPCHWKSDHEYCPISKHWKVLLWLMRKESWCECRAGVKNLKTKVGQFYDFWSESSRGKMSSWGRFLRNRRAPALLSSHVASVCQVSVKTNLVEGSDFQQ